MIIFILIFKNLCFGLCSNLIRSCKAGGLLVDWIELTHCPSYRLRRIFCDCYIYIVWYCLLVVHKHTTDIKQRRLNEVIQKRSNDNYNGTRVDASISPILCYHGSFTPVIKWLKYNCNRFRVSRRQRRLETFLL